MRAKNSKEEKVYHVFDVRRAKAFENGNVSFDLTIDSFITIYNMRVVEGENGDFVSFPKRKGKDGKYYCYVWFNLDEADEMAILEMVQEVLDGK